MADLCTQYSIAGVNINDVTPGADRLLTDFDNGEITGLDGAPVRKTIDPKGQTDGGIVHPAFFGPRIIRFAGSVHIQTVTDASTTAFVAAMNTYEAGVISALEGILNTASALTWTPTGGSAKSIMVTYGTDGGEVEFFGPMLPGQRKFSFTLVAEDPTIS